MKEWSKDFQVQIKSNKHKWRLLRGKGRTLECCQSAWGAGVGVGVAARVVALPEWLASAGLRVTRAACFSKEPETQDWGVIS